MLAVWREASHVVLHPLRSSPQTVGLAKVSVLAEAPPPCVACGERCQHPVVSSEGFHLKSHGLGRVRTLPREIALVSLSPLKVRAHFVILTNLLFHDDVVFAPHFLLSILSGLLLTIGKHYISHSPTAGKTYALWYLHYPALLCMPPVLLYQS